MTRAADDFDAIARRLADMRQHQPADCVCPTDEREDRSKVKAHQTGCPHYVWPEIYDNGCCAVPSPVEHFPEDSWEALRDALGLRGVT